MPVHWIRIPIFPGADESLARFDPHAFEQGVWTTVNEHGGSLVGVFFDPADPEAAVLFESTKNTDVDGIYTKLGATAKTKLHGVSEHYRTLQDPPGSTAA